MIKSINEMIFKDLKWKLFSIAIAAVLWFIGVNVTNPVTSRSFSLLLDLSNLSELRRENIVILNESQLDFQLVNITVQNTRTELEALNADTMTAWLNLSSIDADLVMQADEPVAVDVNVNVNLNMDMQSSHQVVSIQPDSIELELDQLVRQTRPLQVDAPGEVAEGYVLQGVTAGHTSVTVSGPRSLVEKVQTLRVSTNVDGATADIERTENIYAYDADGQDVTNTVTLSVTSTLVRAKILPYKAVDLTVSFKTVPSVNFTITDIQTEPAVVNIMGPAEVLDTLSEITLDGTDNSGASETFTEYLDLTPVLRELGVALMDGEPAQAAVTYTIEPLVRKEFIFLPEEIYLWGRTLDASVTFVQNEPVTIAVRGAESVIETLLQEDIQVEMHLYGLESGAHTVALTIKLPLGFTLDGDPPVLDIIIQPSTPEGPTPGPDETEPMEEGEEGESAGDGANGETADNSADDAADNSPAGAPDTEAPALENPPDTSGAEPEDGDLIEKESNSADAAGGDMPAGSEPAEDIGGESGNDAP